MCCAREWDEFGDSDEIFRRARSKLVEMKMESCDRKQKLQPVQSQVSVLDLTSSSSHLRHSFLGFSSVGYQLRFVVQVATSRLLSNRVTRLDISANHGGCRERIWVIHSGFALQISRRDHRRSTENQYSRTGDIIRLQKTTSRSA